MAGPRQRDALARKRLDDRSPFREAAFVGAQIGNVGGDRCGFGLERQRQAAERAIDIVGGERLAARMARCDAIDARKQRLQFRLHFEHDLRAGARQQWGIADELDAVAETLFGRQQNCALPDGKFAEPWPAAIAAARIGHAGAFPPPFIFGKAARQLPEREEREREV